MYLRVDATALEKQLWIRNEEYSAGFPAIVFNFPHLGGATEEDIDKNQELLRQFFSSCRQFLHPSEGRVYVSLRNTPFYDRWDILDQARQSGYILKR